MYTYVCDERKIPEACVIAAAAVAAVRACIYACVFARCLCVSDTMCCWVFARAVWEVFVYVFKSFGIIERAL